MTEILTMKFMSKHGRFAISPVAFTIEILAI